MSKAITLEMLHAMTPDQRKTLLRNASSLDTPAARAVIELLAQDNLMPAPKVAKAAKPATTRKTPAKAPATPRVKKAPAAPKPKLAVHGRSS